MNLYFFGGTFDPPHLGHLKIIESCLTESRHLVLIPTKQSPFKNHFPMASAYHRIRMLELLISKIDHHSIIIDDWEINNPAPNYTYGTIKHLQTVYPQSKLHMVIGGDQLTNFSKWKNYKKIMDIVQIVAFNRKNFQYKTLAGMQISFMKDFQMDVSSIAIRDKISEGSLPKNDLTPEILEYIQINHLYSYPI